MKKWATSILIFLSFACITVLSGCARKQANPLSKSGFAFDTFITITIYDKKDSSILDKCFEMCDEYEKMLSRTIADSDVSKVNSAGGTPVKVNDDTFELIQKGIYYGELSDGLFDITIAPVTEIWDFHQVDENNVESKKDENAASDSKIPDETELAEAVSHVSYKNIVLDPDNKTVKLMDDKAKIDLGGIAKGYIADKLKEYLKSQGVESALINLGGNILAIGTKPDKSPFHIGIKKPFSNNEILESVDINDKAVSSSGVYERYFYEGDNLYHHILLPSTGYPVDSDLAGASVICESSTDADALSTICILLGSTDAQRLTSQLENVDVIFAY